MIRNWISIAGVLCVALVAHVQAQIPTPRQDVLDAERARQKDPWPRGLGHVILAQPGSLEEAKAYLEPGGSFSPAFRSFGVSLWLGDAAGKVVATSDSIPMDRIHQRLVWTTGKVTPTLHTETDEYTADWSLGAEPNTAQLQLESRPAPGHQMMIAIRSVGPAGAAIDSLKWTGRELWVNGRYMVTLGAAPASVYVGEEGPAGWMQASAGPAYECHDGKGWCYARITVGANADLSMKILDTVPPRASMLSPASTRSTLQVDLPDARFADSLNAQVAHLMMGLVENKPTGGEPAAYPLPWLRDGAYDIVALARAGQLDTAREMARFFAERDFVGGFGAEADNPGLALWAIEEVASRLHDAEFDQYLWPHVNRKAEFILGMQATRKTVKRIFAGPLVPEVRTMPDLYDIAHASRGGLIEGRMDHHYPDLYVTAVSYNGLLDAANLADRLHYSAEATRWREAAARLRTAWNTAFNPHDKDPDPRTFISGVWPTGVASDFAMYRQGLDLQWNSERDAGGAFKYVEREVENGRPLWTYFTFATAHQYLMLNAPARAWQTLEWFWDNQPSPGLYNWWESNHEENSFHEWDYVRGWVKPPYVTPHYWAASECLLLQLDMLAFVDRNAAQPTIEIGGGLPAAWVDRPMQVHGVSTQLGRVDWDWDGHTMTAKVQDDKVAIRLGPGFPAGATVVKQVVP